MSKKLLLEIALVVGLLSCGGAPHEPKKKIPDPIPEHVKTSKEIVLEKRDAYLKLADQVQDVDGFLRDCDSLLHSSLYGVGGADVDVRAARDSSGQWFRTPGHDCYPDRSASTISRDMIIGLTWYAWRKGEPDILTDLLDYASDNLWIMGQGDWKRIFLTPQLRDTIRCARDVLEGKSCKPSFPFHLPGGLKGYQSHLQVLHILIRGEIFGEISEKAFDRLEEHATRTHKNPLYEYAYRRYHDKNYATVWDILATSPQWPSRRLPDTGDRCEENLNQREWGHDWYPCLDEVLKFSGMDLLFVVALIEEE